MLPRGLLDKLTALITAMAELEGQLDAQRSETRALGEELREAVADLARRQEAVEQFLHDKDHRVMPVAPSPGLFWPRAAYSITSLELPPLRARPSASF